MRASRCTTSAGRPQISIWSRDYDERRPHRCTADPRRSTLVEGPMNSDWRGRLLQGAAVLTMVFGGLALASGLQPAPWVGVLEEHPAIQYASRPTTDRVTKLSESIARSA